MGSKRTMFCHRSSAGSALYGSVVDAKRGDAIRRCQSCAVIPPEFFVDSAVSTSQH